MTRSLVSLLIILLVCCSKQEPEDPLLPLQERALSLAAMKCNNRDEMSWLREIVRLAETDVKYKGMIYAIQYSKGVAILHQPWISSCFGCILYDCNGELITTTQSDISEIAVEANEENVIYTSVN